VGNDRIEAYRGPCACGAGEVTISFGTPDHPWLTKSKGFKTSITCGRCRSKYDLIEQNHEFVFVRKSDVKQQHALWSEYWQRSEGLLKAADTRELLNNLGAFLDRQPSLAACHRLLHERDLVYESCATFRKRWTGGSDWVRSHIHASDLGEVLALLGRKDPTISHQLSELEALWQQHKVPLAIVGKPLLDTSSYRG
jgi:hypothetical protein